MEIATLTAFISPFLPFLLNLGGKAIDKASESVGSKFGDAAFEKAQAVWGELGLQVEAKESLKEAATNVANNPENQDLQAALQVQLKKLLEQDEELGKAIAQILEADAPDGTSGNKIVQNVTGDRNQVIGTVIYNYYYREEIDNSAEAVADDRLPCPYRGLFHFGPGDAEYFFGRESFVEELVRATQTRNFIPLLGASGSGKSSVVLAGLVPKLQQAGHWQFTHFRPGADPFHALALALVPLYVNNLDETERIRQARNLAGYFRTGEVLLADVFAQIQQNFPTDRVLLIADQFEELYTLCTDEAIRRDFLDKLLAGIVAPVDHIPFAPILVATMRADFLGNALSYRPFADVLQNAVLMLGPMNRSELTEAIKKPAKKLEVTFEAGLVERILGDVEAEPGILPLLEFALTELWQRRSGKQLTHAAYEAIDEVQGALGRHANQEYAKLSEIDQERVRRIFIQLVRPGEDAEDTRRIATKAELGEQNWSLVKQLADARLLVTSLNGADLETVEVVHEALIRNWGELRGWMKIDRGFRAWQERLRGAMRQWQKTEQDKGSLLRGVALAEAEEKLRERPAEMVSEASFIEQSLQERERLQQAETDRRKREIKTARRITASSLLTVVVSSGLGIMAWKQAQQAQLSEANALSTSALSLIEKGKDLDAFIPAIKAGEILQNQQASNPTVLKALKEALSHKSEYNRLEGDKEYVYSISYCPGGKILATGGGTEKIRLWDIERGKSKLWNIKRRGELSIEKQDDKSVNSVSFSPNCEKLVSSNKNNTIKIWDIKKRALIRTLNGHNSSVNSVSFSFDDKIFASGSEDNTIKLWDANNGVLIRTLDGHKAPVNSVSFSSTKLASGSSDNTIKLWNKKGDFIRTLDKHKKEVLSVSFSPDGTTLASASRDNTIKLWNANNGVLIRTLDGHKSFVHSVNFSSDGKTLVSGSSDNRIKLWNVNTGEVINTLKGHDGYVYNVSFTPDDKTLITGSNDGTIRLWQLENKIRKHKDKVYSVSFSPDGTKLASGSVDNTIKLWDVNGTQIPTETPMIHAKAIYSVSFSPDGTKLASGGADNTIK
jgi:WD40 repeat protein